MIWYLRKIVSTPEPDFWLRELIQIICNANGSRDPSRVAIPHPYKDLAAVVAEQNGIVEQGRQENYKGRSYHLESLIYLFTRRNWRQQMRTLWPRVTYVNFVEYVPSENWRYCLWRSESDGKLLERQPGAPQSWHKLRDEAQLVKVDSIPRVFREAPELLLLFLIAFPHRLNPNFAKFLDNHLN